MSARFLKVHEIGAVIDRPYRKLSASEMFFRSLLEQDICIRIDSGAALSVG
jgi:hypothetical protein